MLAWLTTSRLARSPPTAIRIFGAAGSLTTLAAFSVNGTFGGICSPCTPACAAAVGYACPPTPTVSVWGADIDNVAVNDPITLAAAIAKLRAPDGHNPSFPQVNMPRWAQFDLMMAQTSIAPDGVPLFVSWLRRGLPLSSSQKHFVAQKHFSHDPRNRGC